jgi:hypothetical protein
MSLPICPGRNGLDKIPRHILPIGLSGDGIKCGILDTSRCFVQKQNSGRPSCLCRFDLEPVEIHSKESPGIRVEVISGIQAQS